MCKSSVGLDIDKILEKAAGIENYRYRQGGALESEIALLEKYLGASLPDEYRSFLERYGFAAWFGDAVEGLPENGTRDYRMRNALKTTKYYREKFDAPDYQPVPQYGLVVNRYGGGGYYFLFSKESERAGEVGLFLTETFGQEVSTYDNFTDFLLYLVAKDADEVHPELEALVKEPSLVEVDYSFLDNTK
ncbi:SMI1/KNR4 family protein [Agarivorans sp. Alg241-V36]|uniref:SMI1/KNR4 family protein n=1 Tax=Agarivorans sp. Alg241-V36 TaxID=2305992 RepID=UPI0013D2F60A|nr:SMI1/KNR4 family protein [Agarivorans sp. Alg241-V36]